MQHGTIEIKESKGVTLADNQARAPSGLRAQNLTVIGALGSAMAAMSCCLLPLALFGLGVSGVWIGQLTRLAPYQPYFVGAAVLCIGFGYWMAYHSRQTACADGKACAQPYSSRLVMTGLILATGLIAVTLAFDATASLFL